MVDIGIVRMVVRVVVFMIVDMVLVGQIGCFSS